MEYTRKRWTIVVILFIAFFCTIAVKTTYASANDVCSENKIYCQATLEDNFEANSVLVVLKQKDLNDMKSYTISDFIGIGCEKVTNLTEELTEIIQGKIAENPSASSEKIKEIIAKETLININNFHEILNLELQVKTKENVLNAIKILEQRKDVLFAEPNYIFEVDVCGNESQNFEENDQWNFYGEYGIALNYAENLYNGGTEVKIAVLDTGIDGNHKALSSRLSDNGHMDFLLDNRGVELGKDEKPTDILGHGTHVAGIICAQLNTERNMKGICENVKLYSYQVVNLFNQMQNVVSINAITKATLANIPILNYSIVNSIKNSNEINSLNQAIENYGGLLICAAGNLGRDIDGIYNKNNYDEFSYPSNLALDNVLSVGAIKDDGTIAVRGDWEDKTLASNYGYKSVDIFAPGTDIFSTWPNNTYKASYGTSTAAPHVTGVAALIKSILPDISTSELKSVILENCDKDNRLLGFCTTSDRLNARKAFSSVIYETDSTGEKIVDLRTSPKGEIIIPSQINGKYIIAIGDNVFANLQITDVFFEDNSQIEIIGESAFGECRKLKKVEFPDSLVFIDKYAFQCTDINGIWLDKNVSEIGDYAFYNCKSLKTVKFSSNSQLNHIGDFAFANCGTLDIFNFQNSTLKSIGQAAFSGTNLENFNFQNTLLTDIGMSAFSGTNLKTVRFPDSLNSIGGFAFSNCTNLSSVDFGENSQLTSIGKRAFKNCALSEIEIPKNVTSLGAYIFEDCENLATIHFNAHNCDDCISTSNVFGGTGSNSLEVVLAIQ